MKTTLALLAASVLAGAAALAQLRITSFNPSGELVWTNSASRGFYGVESASTPGGSWNLLGTVADLDWAKTNRIAFQVPLTNEPAFYRVGWLTPNPIGTWDYLGYDWQGTLLVTGQLRIASIKLITSNAPVVYGLVGSRYLEYNGSPTNAPWWLGPQVGNYGTGSFSGTIEFHTASLRLLWPTNVIDNNIQLIGIIGLNTYTGTWNYYTWAGPHAGPFNAVRLPSTNLANVRPDTREGVKGTDDFK